jgi:hypothetical protein
VLNCLDLPAFAALLNDRTRRRTAPVGGAVQGTATVGKGVVRGSGRLG